MEEIFYNEILVGMKITAIPQGSVPQTAKDEPLQLVTLKHKKGSYLKPHLHTPKKRTTDRLQECLIVRSGKIKIDLYSSDKKLFRHIYLTSGQVFILLRGGYGIHIIKDAELIEVKNGPFKEDKLIIEV